jgi:hypothetical protein
MRLRALSCVNMVVVRVHSGAYEKSCKSVTVQVGAGGSGPSGGGEPWLVLGEAREGVDHVAALLSAGADVGAQGEKSVGAGCGSPAA